MAGYTITRSDGTTTLPTIQDGTINTTSTSLGLPGRNYPGYGNSLNTNFVRLVENFASAGTPPPNPIRGQIWFDISEGSHGALKYCTADGTTVRSDWITLTTTSSAGDTNLGNVNVTGNITVGANITVSNNVTSNNIIANTATISKDLNMGSGNASIAVANLGTTKTRVITTGSTSTTGAITGDWTLNGNITGGNLKPATIQATTFLNASGVDITTIITGTYSNTNVASYLTDTGSGFTGNITPTKVTTGVLAVKNGLNNGTISGIWKLASGNDAGIPAGKIEANYADLAERYAADAVYDVGTVVELGGEHEVTSVKTDASNEVFGVVSNTYAYLLNAEAGDDNTHPPIALVGRVPVKVYGPIKKGQRLVSNGNGTARAGNISELTSFNVIGRALEDKDELDVALVLSVVAIR